MDTGVELYEREANIFARTLLVPSSLLRKEVAKFKRQGGLQDTDLKSLSQTFQVEQWVIIARLADLGLIKI